MKPTGLGRGLSALMPDADSKETSDALQIVPISSIHPNPQQPRRDFGQAELADLAASIREKGVIQPLVVRRLQSTSGFELIAGERRLRASQIAGYTELPVRILDVTADQEMLELSIIENLQREDLNAVDLARGYQRLHDEYKLTQEQVAVRVGKDRATVANSLRVLELPEGVLASLRTGEITLGHAKAILMLQGAARQSALWKKVVGGRLSVRQTEEAARAMQKSLAEAIAAPEQRPLSPGIPLFVEYEGQLRQRFNAPVKIMKKGKKGSIRIEFHSDDELDRIMGLLGK